MKHLMVKASALILLGFCLVPASFAQPRAQKDQQSSKPGGAGAGDTGNAAPAGPKVSKAELKAYNAFYAARNAPDDQVISLGEGFVAKYPDSPYAGAVYGKLTQAYLHNNQVDKMLGAGTKALELNPDNIDVLPVMAWAIPRRVGSNTPNGPQQLQEAAKYAHHGIELLSSMPKPAAMDDAEFTKIKNDKLAMCHSGLGTIDAKLGKYDEAMTELNQAVQLESTPDPVDYYLLGLSDEMTSHFTDAIGAYTKCADQPGSLQATCKGNIEETKNKAKNSLEAPK
jgi:tetratricopeptide (TPR) repeat protein